LLALNKGFADPEKELEIWTNIIIEYSELEGDTNFNSSMVRLKDCL
jgi:hypothetical protein